MSVAGPRRWLVLPGAGAMHSARNCLHDLPVGKLGKLVISFEKYTVRYLERAVRGHGCRVRRCSGARSTACLLLASRPPHSTRDGYWTGSTSILALYAHGLGWE